MVTDVKFKIEETENKEKEDKDEIQTFGTLDCGYETMAEAWPTLEHVFPVGDENQTRLISCREDD